MSRLTVNPNDILGKTELDAAAALLIHGINIRVVSRDGQAITHQIREQYDPNLWDVEIVNGHVYAINLPTQK